jgi:hypothetical protein
MRRGAARRPGAGAGLVAPALEFIRAAGGLEPSKRLPGTIVLINAAF